MPRFFAAIHPPPEVTAELLSALTSIEFPDTTPRALSPAQVHCTLLFIGDRDEHEVSGVMAGCEAACAGIAPFRLQPVRLFALPERGPKRSIAFECDRPAGLLELRRRFVQRLARPTKRGRRAYLPHITIGRFPDAGIDFELDAPVAMPGFPVDAIHLVESVLRPEGAEHRIIHRVTLSQS